MDHDFKKKKKKKSLINVWDCFHLILKIDRRLLCLRLIYDIGYLDLRNSMQMCVTTFGYLMKAQIYDRYGVKVVASFEARKGNHFIVGEAREWRADLVARLRYQCLNTLGYRRVIIPRLCHAK